MRCPVAASCSEGSEEVDWRCHERDEDDGRKQLCGFWEGHGVSIAPLKGSPAGLDMDSTVRTLVVISLFAALCAIVAFLLDQVFVAAIFAAELATALVEAIRRSR